jgi:hypothetical protein
LAALAWPTRLNASITAVGVVIGVSIVAAGLVTLRHGRRENAPMEPRAK